MAWECRPCKIDMGNGKMQNGFTDLPAESRFIGSRQVYRLSVNPELLKRVNYQEPEQMNGAVTKNIYICSIDFSLT